MKFFFVDKKFSVCVWLLFLVSVLLAQGCRKQTQPAPGKFVAEVSRPLESLAMDDILVSVNGASFTRGNFELLLTGMEKSLQARRPGVSTQEIKMLRKRWSYALIGEFVAKELMVQEARRRGLEASQEALSQSKASFLDKLAQTRNVEIDSFADSPESDIRALYAMVLDNATVETLRQAEFGERLIITTNDLEETKNRIQEYNAMCVKTNELVMARATAIVERLRSGEDFTKVATETTQDEDHPDGYWGRFARVEIDDDKVADAAFRLPVGSVSDPFDTDEGLVIIKILDREGIDASTALDPAEATLGRIVLWLAEEYAEESDEALKQRMAKERLQELQGAFLRSLQEKARLEYPNGTNFFPRVKKSGRIKKSE